MSEPNSPSTEAAVTNGRMTDGSGRDQETAANDAPPQDPWFESDQQPGGTQPADGLELGPGGDLHDTGWFLRTGRAGLMPDSMTETWEETGHSIERPETSAAPPWAGDRAEQDAGAPPPWESGPWPGPGEDGPNQQPAAGTDGHAVVSPAAADTGNWQATAAVGAGLVPLVLPGLILGVIGLRRSQVTGTGRTASWLAIGLSVIWAAILIVWLASAGGTAAGGCGSYQNAVSIQVSQVLHDLATGAPQTVLTADLRQAITQANSAAAQAQQVTARDAMATLTAGLQQVAAEGSRSATARHQQVAADAAAMASACKA